jgi:antitoxin component HigA of HigAB toxin-antitoxin module
MIDINDRVIKNIKDIMIKKNLNQNRIAENIGQTRQAVSLCFSRKRNMTLENIEKLSNYFDVEIQDLFK